MRKNALFFAAAAVILSAAALLFGCGAQNQPPQGNQTGENPDDPAKIPANAKPNVSFTLELDKRLGVIDNKLSDINMWDYHFDWLDNAAAQQEDYFKKNMPFVKYVHFMQATGGNEQRDLFADPKNTQVRDDYKFDSLIAACKNALRQGLKPYIKTGNVPLKLSSNPVISKAFGVNVMPPDDYEEYYRYIKAIADALVAEFGADEVKTWKWGVLTEYENRDWFSADDDPEQTKISYFKLYDYTVAALEDSIGPDVYVGAHSMTCSEGLWNEQEFIEHCAKGVNYKTGKIGTRLCFLSCSYYDYKPGRYMDRSLVQTIEVVRSKAEQLGLRLKYGIDEGRLLVGTDDKDLTSRVVGQTYQAGYDARLIKIMLDNNIDYFSSWSYTTNGIWGGVPTVSLHTANLFYKMVGSERVAVEKSGKAADADAEVDAFAGCDAQSGKIYIMAYNFKNTLEYTKTEKVEFALKVPDGFGGKVKVTRYMVDDNANFFDEWLADRKEYKIRDEDFGWSKDSAVVNSTTLPSQMDLSVFHGREKAYIEAAKLEPTSGAAEVKDGALKLYVEIPPHAVVFYEIEAAK